MSFLLCAADTHTPFFPHPYSSLFPRGINRRRPMEENRKVWSELISLPRSPSRLPSLRIPLIRRHVSFSVGNSPARAKRPPADSERSDDVSRIRRLYLSSRGEVRAPHGWTRRRTSVRRRLGYCLNLGAKRLCSFHHEGRGQQVVLLSTDTSEASSTHYVVVHRFHCYCCSQLSSLSL
ncbi:hypothetical protein BHE74_00028635 [Ensete ventricosum]|nr:hypothetical protein BHE74_00028635 [Ensete ventricosum]